MHVPPLNVTVAPRCTVDGLAVNVPCAAATAEAATRAADAASTPRNARLCISTQKISRSRNGASSSCARSHQIQVSYT